MYRILCDTYVLYHPSISQLKIFVPLINLEINSVGTFSFTIYPTHPIYGSIQKMKSSIEVYDDEQLIFRGRPLKETMNFLKGKTFLCEGDLAFLNDGIIHPFDFQGSIPDFLTLILDDYNSQVELSKKIYLGNVTVTDPNDYIVRSSIEFDRAWTVISDKLINSELGGYVLLRRINNVNYLDYLADGTAESTQKIQFQKNLLDLSRIVDATSIATRIIPLGAKLKDESGNDTDVRLSIESVNDGKDYLENTTASNLYTRITAVKIWEDVTDANNLRTKGAAELNTISNLGIEVKLNAMDLGMINVDIQKLRFFTYVRVISKPHDIDAQMLIKQMSLDLVNPQNNTVKVGLAYLSLTDQQLNTDKAIKKIEADYVTNQVVRDVKENVVNLSTLIQQTAEDVTILSEKTEGLETETAELQVKYDGIVAGVESAGNQNMQINANGEDDSTEQWTFVSSPPLAKNPGFWPADSNHYGAWSINENGPIFAPIQGLNTISTVGFHYWLDGLALGNKRLIVPGEDISVTVKVKGNAKLKFLLRIFTNSSFVDVVLFETDLSSTFQNYGATVFTNANQTHAQLIVLSYIDLFNDEFAIHSDLMFNLGTQKRYSPSVAEAMAKIQLLSTGITAVHEEIDNVRGRVDNTTVQINAARGVQINTTANESFGITNSRTGEKILTVYNEDLYLRGNLEAGKVGGWEITNTKLVSPNGLLEFDAEKSTTKYGTIQMKYSTDFINPITSFTETTIDVRNLDTNPANAFTNLNIHGKASAKIVVEDELGGLGYLASNAGSSLLSVNRVKANAIMPEVHQESLLGNVGSEFGYAYITIAHIVNANVGIVNSDWVRPQSTSAGMLGQSNRRYTLYGSQVRYTSLVNDSDIRLKHDIKNVNDEYVDMILNTDIIEYKYIEERDPTQQRRIGIDAVVIKEKFGDLSEFIVGESEDGFYYSEMINYVPMLIKTVQYLNAEIKSLKGEIN